MRDPVFGLSDEQIERVGRQIAVDLVSRDTADRRANRTYIDHKYALDDWDDELFISQDMYEQWLSAVQQEKSSAITRRPWNEDTEFHMWLRDALVTLDVREQELVVQRDAGDIDIRTYQVARDLVDRARGALRKFLERPERQQLIGV